MGALHKYGVNDPISTSLPSEFGSGVYRHNVVDFELGPKDEPVWEWTDWITLHLNNFTHEKMSLKRSALISFFLVASIFNSCDNDINQPHNDPNVDGFVPDGETAIRIAEAVWLPIYGSEIKYYKPFAVELLDTVWHVKGDRGADFGGIIHLYISKKDAKIQQFRREK